MGKQNKIKVNIVPVQLSWPSGGGITKRRALVDMKNRRYHIQNMTLCTPYMEFHMS